MEVDELLVSVEWVIKLMRQRMNGVRGPYSKRKRGRSRGAYLHLTRQREKGSDHFFAFSHPF